MSRVDHQTAFVFVVTLRVKGDMGDAEFLIPQA